jgi:hypothetical protein
MRTELNVITGEVTEHEDAPVTFVEPAPIVIVTLTVEELMIKLNEIQKQIQDLQGTV